MHLVAMTAAHFDWLLGTCAAPVDAPTRIADGGIAEPAILELMRDLAVELGGEAAWLMVVDDAAVGIVSIKSRGESQLWDIGYGVAPSANGRGHATVAVGLTIARARALGAAGLTAETLAGGGTSSRILQRNGVGCTGQFDHPEDGMVDQWAVTW